MTEGSSKTKRDSVQQERDLGLIVSSNVKLSHQCIKAASTARNCNGEEKLQTSRSDKTYIHPHLEYCIPAWSPYLIKHIEVLERVQKTATDLVPQLQKFCYSERLKVLGITTLKDPRERGDMIEVFKILTGREHIDSSQFFEPAKQHYSLRGHGMKLSKTRSQLEIGKHFFSQRVVNAWKSLPSDVVNAKTVSRMTMTAAIIAPVWTSEASELARP